ncbi:hypothetical protein GCM10009677_39380 [Sphaerisporangium rubeum]
MQSVPGVTCGPRVVAKTAPAADTMAPSRISAAKASLTTKVGKVPALATQEITPQMTQRDTGFAERDFVS